MDEYVSKSYLITKFNELADKYAGNERKRQRALAYATAADIIKLVDAADVQPVKHGRWSECYTDTHHYSGICSVCGKASIKSLAESLYAFCPKCGARMDGDTE
jgi:hypothetical protein